MASAKALRKEFEGCVSEAEGGRGLCFEGKANIIWNVRERSQSGFKV